MSVTRHFLKISRVRKEHSVKYILLFSLLQHGNISSKDYKELFSDMERDQNDETNKTLGGGLRQVIRSVLLFETNERKTKDNDKQSNIITPFHASGKFTLS